MTYPFIKRFGKNYQQFKEFNNTNKFKVINDIAVVTPINNERIFLVDLDTWNKLPWSEWKLNSNNYISCCGIQLHRIVAYLNGLLEDDPNAYIEHKNRNRCDCRIDNLRPCTPIQNGWNVEKKHGHQLKSGKWKFTFSKSFPTMAEAEHELGIGNFQYMSKNRTCFTECTFDTYEEGITWWKFQAGIHYGEFSPFANPYMSCEDVIAQKQIPDIQQS